MTQSEKTVNAICDRLSLRAPQRESLEWLARITELVTLEKNTDAESLASKLDTIHREFPSVTDFEHDFPSFCFALATGVGKTRLMGALITYLYQSLGYKHYFVLAPNLTIYNKLIADFTSNTPKYVFKGIAEFAQEPPVIVTGENYEAGLGTYAALRFSDSIVVNIFNILKINSEVRGGKAPRIKRLSEYIGQSYFDYLSSLDDLVMVMDESHRYRADAGMKAISELHPLLGLEMTATPFIERSGKQVKFKNILIRYTLAQAINDGFVKSPAVVTRANFNPDSYSSQEFERIKLEDGIRLHENTKAELLTYSRNTGRSFVKPFMLIVARDTTHAGELLRYIKSGSFFNGTYKDKVIQIDSSQSGDEKEENIQRLLAVENTDEPTEIVIHVNMLKEGWDVTNLYTIIPLRAADSRTLVEQCIGRGLRLPYGRRTGVQAVDRLNIVAHDNFQRIIDESNRNDSPLRLSALYLDNPGSSGQKLKSVDAPSCCRESVWKLPEVQTPDAHFVAETTMNTITAMTGLAGLHQLNDREVREKIIDTVHAVYRIQHTPDLGLEIAGSTPDIPAIVNRIADTFIEKTISIPRIVLVPEIAGETGNDFPFFTLDCTAINFQPVEHDILIQHLQSHKQEVLPASDENSGEEQKPENLIVEQLVSFDDISYDKHADVLYDLAAQAVAHLHSYLPSDTEVYNVVHYYRRELAAVIHTQMVIQKQNNTVTTGYNAKITAGFTEIRNTAYTVAEDQNTLDIFDASFDRSKIKTIVFGNFHRCLYSVCKFDSDPERRFAAFLESDSSGCLKWFKPVKGQIGIYYRQPPEVAASAAGDADLLSDSEYVPDFIAEFSYVYVMAEVKAQNELTDPVVHAKKDAAVLWCRYASEYNAKSGQKPWIHLLIPDTEICDNRTLKYYLQFEGKKKEDKDGIH